MAPTSKRKTALAARAWQRLFDFFISTRPERDRTLESRGLTSNDSRALMTLDRDSGRSMGSLAGEWGCDASNATWIIDRLERLGYAERRPSPTDRRARLVVLTPSGAKAKAEILAEFRTPPATFLRLNESELETLAAVLEKVSPEVRSESSNAGERHATRAADRPAPGARARR